MVGQLPILFWLTGAAALSQLQSVSILHCEAKGHVVLLWRCDFRHSCLRVISSHANCTTYRNPKDMAVSAHTYLPVRHMCSYFGLNLYALVFASWNSEVRV